MTVFERNAFFEPLFYKSKEKFPGNKMEEFVNDLKAVKDCYIDVVVSTLILSSVKNVESTLSEIQRVMVPVSPSRRALNPSEYQPNCNPYTYIIYYIYRSIQRQYVITLLYTVITHIVLEPL